MRYSVAADASTLLESQAVSEGPEHSGMVPAGELHAVDEGADETMCERPVAGRISFATLDFERLSGAMTGSRCPRCVAAVAAAEQTAAPPAE